MIYSGAKFIFKGILGIIFGLLIIAVPRFTLGAFLTLFAILLIGAGIISFLFGVTSRQTDTLFWFLIAGGIIVLGILAFIFQAIAAAIFAIAIAGWALVTGVWDLERYICSHRRFYAIIAVFSITSLSLIAVLLYFFPLLRNNYVTTICGAFAFVFGIFAIILGWMIISGKIPPCLLPGRSRR